MRANSKRALHSVTGFRIVQKVQVSTVVKTTCGIYPVVNFVMGTAGGESDAVSVQAFRFGKAVEQIAIVGDPFWGG